MTAARDRALTELCALPVQAQPKDIALMTGAELWSMPDDKLRKILEGEWRVVAYFALWSLIPEMYAAIEVRFGEQLNIDLTADVLAFKGYDGETFRHLPRMERIDLLDNLAQERLRRQTGVIYERKKDQ